MKLTTPDWVICSSSLSMEEREEIYRKMMEELIRAVRSKLEEHIDQLKQENIKLKKENEDLRKAFERKA